MAAIPLNALGRAYLTLNPPWANKLFSLRMLANPKGVVPPQLEKFQKKPGDTPIEALRVVAARGGTSGGNAKTRKQYARSKKGPPTRTLAEILK
jgi:hypothetical protein